MKRWHQGQEGREGHSLSKGVEAQNTAMVIDLGVWTGGGGRAGIEDKGHGVGGVRLRSFDLIREAEGAGVRGPLQGDHLWGSPACSWRQETGADAKPAPSPRSLLPLPSDAGSQAPFHPLIMNRNTKQFISSLQEPSKNRRRGCNNFRGWCSHQASDSLSKAAHLSCQNGARKLAGFEELLSGNI